MYVYIERDYIYIYIHIYLSRAHENTCPLLVGVSELRKEIRFVSVSQEGIWQSGRLSFGVRKALLEACRPQAHEAPCYR